MRLRTLASCKLTRSWKYVSQFKPLMAKVHEIQCGGSWEVQNINSANQTHRRTCLFKDWPKGHREIPHMSDWLTWAKNKLGGGTKVLVYTEFCAAVAMSKTSANERPRRSCLLTDSLKKTQLPRVLLLLSSWGFLSGSEEVEIMSAN